MLGRRSRPILAASLLAKSTFVRLRSALLGPYVAALLVESRQGRFLVPTEDVTVAGRLALHGSYEERALQLYRRLLRPTDRVLVVGAHVGALVVPVAKMASRVVAVEANPRIFELLQRNLDLNAVSNVDSYCLAALDRSGKVDFLDSRVNSGGSKVLPRRRRFEFVHDRPKVISVEAGPLDGVLAGEFFDVVLLDIEGAEYKAMLGMRRILSRARILICELIPNHLENVSGVSLDEFAAAIPPNFTDFAVVSKPDERMSRDGLTVLYQRAASSAYFGGTDLLCTASP